MLVDFVGGWLHWIELQRALIAHSNLRLVVSYFQIKRIAFQLVLKHWNYCELRLLLFAFFRLCETHLHFKFVCYEDRLILFKLPVVFVSGTEVCEFALSVFEPFLVESFVLHAFGLIYQLSISVLLVLFETAFELAVPSGDRRFAIELILRELTDYLEGRIFVLALSVFLIALPGTLVLLEVAGKFTITTALAFHHFAYVLRAISVSCLYVPLNLTTNKVGFNAGPVG